MAARMNKKRSFLFVSKVLGKHIPVNPHVSLLAGAALGVLYAELLGKRCEVSIDELVQAFTEPETAVNIYSRLMAQRVVLDKPTTFIGFAETATALGHSMYDLFAGRTKFLHTTREIINELESVISFEEEHSHATSHRCYAVDPELFQDDAPIVLVDDEMTTGKTALNIIRELHASYPRQTYVVASLLDWRSAADRAKFVELEQELGIAIPCLSLLEGSIEVTGQPVLSEREQASQHTTSTAVVKTIELGAEFEHRIVTSTTPDGFLNDKPYLAGTGRFGLLQSDNLRLEENCTAAASILRQERQGERTLCLGTGEFMFVPMRIASLMGEGVLYQSTTRSPVHPVKQTDYAIQSAYSYPSLDDPAVTNYLYNVQHGMYDDVFIFIEREVRNERIEPLLRIVKGLGFVQVNLVMFTSQP
ncbi:phosphoribosyltransferase family protein [Paenibacillus oenotherae]|uniref:Phosphoribosyltransferase family protein n=2 Tax=Paenibacillus oenotherae TaxID=1435645 RepID=A0ABS7DAF4_9BACL|nr:phosphoribosyltransferase family protein [Paenibacillus oenotherae]